MVKAKRKPGRPKGSKIKHGEVYDIELYEDKPNCPQCNERDYRIKVGKTENGYIKIYASCNNCGKKFIYNKSLSHIFSTHKEVEISV